MEAEELDDEMTRRGLMPETPSRTVTKETEKGLRVVINALYRKRPQKKKES